MVTPMDAAVYRIARLEERIARLEDRIGRMASALVGMRAELLRRGRRARVPTDDGEEE